MTHASAADSRSGGSVDWKAIWRQARAKDQSDFEGGLGRTDDDNVPLPNEPPETDTPTGKKPLLQPGHDGVPDEESSESDDNESEGTQEPTSAGSPPIDVPPLSDELFQHGGSYMYQHRGDRLGTPALGTEHFQFLRLPVNWIAPEPVTGFTEFLGADPVHQLPPEKSGYSMDPRFVAAGSYTAFGLAFEQDVQKRAAIGQQLLLDFDLRLTGTERFHVQWRPLGERMTGGSWYNLTKPRDYVDNSTITPDRYWFESELHSLLGSRLDPLASQNTNMVIGKFPFSIHNNLLMNDEILGGIIGRNNIPFAQTSNLNVQVFTGLNDVDTYAGVESQVAGLHATIDHRKQLYEVTYAYVNSHGPRDTHFLGLSGTRFFGLLSLAGRAMFKIGDDGGTGDSQLCVLESNYTRAFEPNPLNFETAVFFSNAFWAADGWNSIGGGNFNRLRTGFEVNPLIRLSTTPGNQNTVGATVGVQLFRHHEDESLIPEFAWESPNGDSVYGAGLRYLRKTGSQTYLEILGLINRSPGTQHDRDGIFVSHTIVF
ncbi:MAG: hypothetical protein R3C59_30765 [Planctomycetaceae bacterium]